MGTGPARELIRGPGVKRWSELGDALHRQSNVSLAVRADGCVEQDRDIEKAAASGKTAIPLSPLLRDYLYTPESDARFVRVILKSAEGASGYGIRDITVRPLDWAASENDLFFAMARDAPRGSYPRYLSSEQSYWTVIGVDRDSAEALINEEGMIEVGRGQFSIEPFLYIDGKLVTWNDVSTSVASNAEALPLPQVVWSTKDLDLTISAFAAGPVDSSVLYARYRITNNSKTYKKPTLFLALRPLQVNPPWQFLNLPGGVARVDSISFQGSSARVTGNKFVRSLASVSGFGAVTFDDGNIVDWLRLGKVPAPFSVTDPTGHASAAFAYQLELGPARDVESDRSRGAASRRRSESRAAAFRGAERVRCCADANCRRAARRDSGAVGRHCPGHHAATGSGRARGLVAAGEDGGRVAREARTREHHASAVGGAVHADDARAARGHSHQS